MMKKSYIFQKTDYKVEVPESVVGFRTDLKENGTKIRLQNKNSCPRSRFAGFEDGIFEKNPTIERKKVFL